MPALLGLMEACTEDTFKGVLPLGPGALAVSEPEDLEPFWSLKVGRDLDKLHALVSLGTLDEQPHNA